MTVNGNASHMLSNANASMDIVRHSIEYMSTQNHINLTAYQLALTAEDVYKRQGNARALQILLDFLGDVPFALPVVLRPHPAVAAHHHIAVQHLIQICLDGLLPEHGRVFLEGVDENGPHLLNIGIVIEMCIRDRS